MSVDHPPSPEQRAAHRRWIREHHPDRGGDPAEFAAGLARLRADASRAPRGGPGRAAARPADRYDAPIEIVGDHQRMRAAVARWWRRFHRSGPPRVQ